MILTTMSCSHKNLHFYFCTETRETKQSSCSKIKLIIADLEMVDTNEVESHLIDRYEIRRRLGKILLEVMGQ